MKSWCRKNCSMSLIPSVFMAVRSAATMAGTAAATAAGTVLRVPMFPGLASHILSKVSQTLK